MRQVDFVSGTLVFFLDPAFVFAALSALPDLWEASRIFALGSQSLEMHYLAAQRNQQTHHPFF